MDPFPYLKYNENKRTRKYDEIDDQLNMQKLTTSTYNEKATSKGNNSTAAIKTYLKLYPQNKKGKA